MLLPVVCRNVVLLLTVFSLWIRSLGDLLSSDMVRCYFYANELQICLSARGLFASVQTCISSLICSTSGLTACDNKGKAELCISPGKLSGVPHFLSHLHHITMHSQWCLLSRHVHLWILLLQLECHHYLSHHLLWLSPVSFFPCLPFRFFLALTASSCAQKGVLHFPSYTLIV